jgi:hypothetical protein
MCLPALLEAQILLDWVQKSWPKLKLIVFMHRLYLPLLEVEFFGGEILYALVYI